MENSLDVSLWNPLDYVRVFGWLFLSPEKLQPLTEDRARRIAAILSASLLWLSLISGLAGLWLGAPRSVHSAIGGALVKIFSGGAVLAWFLLSLMGGANNVTRKPPAILSPNGVIVVKQTPSIGPTSLQKNSRPATLLSLLSLLLDFVVSFCIGAVCADGIMLALIAGDVMAVLAFVAGLVISISILVYVIRRALPGSLISRAVELMVIGLGIGGFVFSLKFLLDLFAPGTLTAGTGLPAGVSIPGILAPGVIGRILWAFLVAFPLGSISLGILMIGLMRDVRPDSEPGQTSFQNMGLIGVLAVSYVGIVWSLNFMSLHPISDAVFSVIIGK